MARLFPPMHAKSNKTAGAGLQAQPLCTVGSMTDGLSLSPPTAMILPVGHCQHSLAHIGESGREWNAAIFAAQMPFPV